MIYRTLHTRQTVPFPRSSAGQYLIFVNDASDPIFFLLHGQLDRAWAAWQAHDRRNRKAIAGGVDQDLNNFNTHPLGIGTPVTKDTVIYMAGIGPDARVNDVLSTTEGYLCYQYDHV